MNQEKLSAQYCLYHVFKGTWLTGGGPGEGKGTILFVSCFKGTWLTGGGPGEGKGTILSVSCF